MYQTVVTTSTHMKGLMKNELQIELSTMYTTSLNSHYWYMYRVYNTYIIS